MEELAKMFIKDSTDHPLVDQTRYEQGIKPRHPMYMDVVTHKRMYAGLQRLQIKVWRSKFSYSVVLLASQHATGA